MDIVNNRCQNEEEPPPPGAALPMQVDAFHYANGSDEGEEASAAPLVHASSALHARTSELTISFEGGVYVCPAVTQQKVQAVLLLWGGQEMPNGVPTSDFLLQQNSQAGTLRDLTKAGRIAFEQNELDTSADIKPSKTEAEHSCAKQDKEGSPEETKPVQMDSRRSHKKANEQFIIGTAESVTDNLSIQVENHALSLHEQDTLEDLADASGTEFEIPAGFDEQVDIDDSNMRTYWL